LKPNAVLALLLAGITVTYCNHFSNGFHFDDFHTVTDNPAIRSLRNVPRFLTDASTFSVLPANQTYRPMVSASLAMDYALAGGYKPFWFHLTTFVLFVGLVCLLFVLYRTLMDKIRPSPANAWLALGGAAWFGLHPAMAETVNYVIQRGDLYCTLGCVGALVVFALYPEQRKWGLYLLPLVAALLSKPPAAVFPALLLLYVFFFEQDGLPVGERWRKSAIAGVPSLAVTGLMLWLQSAMTPKSFTPSIMSATDYRLTQPYVWLRYFGALFLPLHLNADTDLGPFSGLNLEACAGILFVAALAVTIVYTARRRETYPIAFGLLWFVITQLPTSLYPLSEVENDHRMFFSFAGLIVAVVWTGALLVLQWTTAEQRVRLQPVAAVLAVIVLGGYGYGTHKRNEVWRTEESLWLDDVQKSPHNGRGLMNYALTQLNKGNNTVALTYFERALEYTPNYPTLEINLGVVNGAMADSGDAARSTEAERHFLRAIALAPQDDSPHTFYGRWLLTHGRAQEAIGQLQTAIAQNPARMLQREMLVAAYQELGQTGAARQAAQEALAIDPTDAGIQQALALGGPNAAFWLNLSLTQYNQRLYKDSIDSARHALELDPRMAEAWNNIGAGEAGLQQWDEAIHAEEEALRLNPQLQIAKNNLAFYTQQKTAAGTSVAAGAKTAADYINESLALNKAGKYSESLAAAREAVRLDPKSAVAWNNVAAADEELRRWDDAIDAAKHALALQPDFQLARNNLAWSMKQKELVGKK
jgi:tetratricopeptide (TPR) repeat protein